MPIPSSILFLLLFFLILLLLFLILLFLHALPLPSALLPSAPHSVPSPPFPPPRPPTGCAGWYVPHTCLKIKMSLKKCLDCGTSGSCEIPDVSDMGAMY